MAATGVAPTEPFAEQRRGRACVVCGGRLVVLAPAVALAGRVVERRVLARLGVHVAPGAHRLAACGWQRAVSAGLPDKEAPAAQGRMAGALPGLAQVPLKVVTAFVFASV